MVIYSNYHRDKTHKRKAFFKKRCGFWEVTIVQNRGEVFYGAEQIDDSYADTVWIRLLDEKGSSSMKETPEKANHTVLARHITQTE